MKNLLTLFTILIVNSTAFSQSVIVKKVYLDKVIEELRTKDVWQERLKLQDSLIAGLEKEVKVNQTQTALSNQYYQSCITEKSAWQTKSVNFEKLYKSERGKKRKKGCVNVLLTLALGGVSYLYIVK